MELTPKLRAQLHGMLDNLLDESPRTEGVLILREISVLSRDGSVEEQLSMRGVVAKDAPTLNALVQQIRNPEE